MATFRFGGMRSDVGLERLVGTKGPCTDGASEWAIGSCGVVAGHRLGSETMDDGGAELVGEREMEIESGASA